ncbi:inositol monophosphatase family protein [Undibacterium sp. TJN19]|uniref:inositol monophosphatase family protein n=1 Tax=Undibacterium sp. TJN19 TaxID=3413055 RepID=UPI003BF0A2A6
MKKEISAFKDETVTDETLLHAVVEIAHDAAENLLQFFSPDNRPKGKSDMFEAGKRNEELVADQVTTALKALRPNAKFVEEAQETAPLPSGEWWVVDHVEGNVNHVHGMPEWAITIALMRDGLAVLAVVRQPVGDLTYTAIRGKGAFLNGRRLQVSKKMEMNAALVGTGQAEGGQIETYRRIADSIFAMLQHALLVRASVPSTFPMVLVAAGHMDVFWQYQPVLPGVAPGILFIEEAGGRVSRIDGTAWKAGDKDILVSAPGLHQAAIDILKI